MKPKHVHSDETCRFRDIEQVQDVSSFVCRDDHDSSARKMLLLCSKVVAKSDAFFSASVDTPMPTLDEIKDTLRLYATHQQHPTQVDEAHAALVGFGDLVIDGLIWGLQQADIDMKLLALQLLQEHFADAERAFPAVRALISDDEDRLVRVTAINTLYVMGDVSDDLIPLLTPRLESGDDFERISAAGNLWRISRSEDAYVVLRREANREGSPMAEMAAGYLEGCSCGTSEDRRTLRAIVDGAEMTVAIRPETGQDQKAIWSVNRAAFEGDAEANLVDALRDGGFVEVSLVAEVDREIVGHILFSRVAIVTNVGTVDALSLAPMAVLPSHQRQGIGNRLVEAGLEACREAGYGIVVVLGHPEFYPRFGFSAELARRLESPFGGGEAWMAMELVPGVLDGVDGRVEYSPPFTALE